MMNRRMKMAALVVAVAGAAGAATTRDAAEPTQWVAAEEHEMIERVGGEPIAEVQRVEGGWQFRAGPCVTDAPLPEGYPRPTPPGAIELKFFPSIRRAEFGSGERDGNAGFMPLFRHINSRDIPMTAPVEMDLSDRGATMSFLYERPEQGATGEAPGDVRVVDTEARWFLCYGHRGRGSGGAVREGREKLLAWLDSQTEWAPAGPPRWAGYNGPRLIGLNKWWEYQIPVQRVADAESANAAD